MLLLVSHKQLGDCRGTPNAALRNDSIQKRKQPIIARRYDEVHVGWVSDSVTQQYSKINLLKAGFRASTQPTRANSTLRQKSGYYEVRGSQLQFANSTIHETDIINQRVAVEIV